MLGPHKFLLLHKGNLLPMVFGCYFFRDSVSSHRYHDLGLIDLVVNFPWCHPPLEHPFKSVQPNNFLQSIYGKDQAYWEYITGPFLSLIICPSVFEISLIYLGPLSCNLSCLILDLKYMFASCHSKVA